MKKACPRSSSTSPRPSPASSPAPCPARPAELLSIDDSESAFIPRAMSSKAAGGMWQFVKFRGNEYGLHQTPLTDDRMDPEMATRAAAHHLHDLYSEFGDWYLAIAAYNCGPVVVEGAVARTGYADFWELRSRSVLPAETTNYVPIILAMTIMEKNAAEYGLDGIQMDPPLDYDSVELSAKTSFALVSDITETPLSELASLNPAVLKSVAPAGYSLRVPKGSATQLWALRAAPSSSSWVAPVRARRRFSRIDVAKMWASWLTRPTRS